MSTNEKILNSYNEGNFKELLDRLDADVDELGNTIIHHIASKLDQNALESLKKLDKRCITYTLMNKANKNGDLPIHLALKSLIEKDADSHEFISYLIDHCQANPNISNKEGMVITKKEETTKEMIVKPSHPVDHTDFIAKLTQYYVNDVKHQNVPAKGGYSSKRVIRSKISDFTDSELLSDTGVNDTFRLTRVKHRNVHSNSQDGGKRDPKITETYNEILKKIMKIMNVDEADAKLYRMALKKMVVDKHPELREQKKDAEKMKKIEELIDDDKKAKKLLTTEEMKKTIAGLRDWLSEQEAKRSENATSDKPKRKVEKKEHEPKTKRATKKTHESEKGYLHSDEILFSADYF